MTPEPGTFLAWDTAFFGVRIGRVNGQRLDAAQLQAVMAWRAAQQVACLYFLADSSDPMTIRTAESGGFRLQDVRLTFALARPAQAVTVPPDTPNSRVRPARAADLAELHATARQAYIHSRFYNDPHFTPEQCATLYDTWLTRSILEQGAYAAITFVAELDGRAAGYISCHVDPVQPVGTIGLVGVAEVARGQALGQQLVQHALDWFWAQGMTQVQVTTQGRNIAGQRLYQRAGFLTQSMLLWYHWWLND